MERSSVTIVRFDIHSGSSDVVRSFLIPRDSSVPSLSPLASIKIGNDVVAAQQHGRMVVGNWRTGDARVIDIERVSSPFLKMMYDLRCYNRQ